jgi:acylphosphatase
MKRIRVSVRVQGRVQGVGFRYFTHITARALQLTGWVRNLPGGDVEVVAEGPRQEVEQLLAALREGPAGSRVEQVSVEQQPCREEFVSFEVRF